LVTSGPTSVKIDDVRVITNRSTGEMGRLIAQAFSAKGASVTLLEGAVTTACLPGKAKIIKFFELSELSEFLKRELRRGYAIVVHAAAVSDFELTCPFRGKISSGKTLTLKLKPTRKLIDDIKRLAPDSTLVAFKFEPSISGQTIKSKVAGLMASSGADLVVANRSMGRSYTAFITRTDHSVSPRVSGKRQLVKVLLREIDQLLFKRR
jgi:phosphopantothenoylcysteine decarboxylase/phosphopantothenate--cysteine ligase